MPGGETGLVAGRLVLFLPHEAAFSTWEEEKVLTLGYTTSVISIIISIQIANSQRNVTFKKYSFLNLKYFLWKEW